MIDPLSAEGRFIRQQVDELLASKRTTLEKPTLTHDESQLLRGQIKAFKTVLTKIFPEEENK